MGRKYCSICKFDIRLNKDNGAARRYDRESFKTWGEKRWYYKKQRQLVVKRDKVCQKCSRDCRLHVHHIVPIKEGGTHDMDNLISLCPRCHMGEHKLMRELNKNTP